MRGLSRERWKRIEEILDEALELPSEARADFVQRACAGDPELRFEVEQLLAADAAVSGVLDDSADSSAALLLGSGDDAPTSRVGEVVGPYRIESEVARGGMGTVYVAQRIDGQFEQRVALKLVRRGMDSDDVHRRFIIERQILARLDHPNIARLLGGGQTADGRPWFAMELVAGSQITSWCDQRRLGIEARIDLMIQVCDAVSYAHRSLVVHRDLKPSNILVTDEGVVKLLDFGIAKVLRDQESRGDTVTQLGARAMTPEYAAPEQVRGGPITTATDTYALGTVLYELLSGHRAHRLRRRSAAEVERVVCDDVPEAPSSAVTRADERSRSDGTIETIDPSAIAAARGAPPARLRRILDGDLDTIVLKALRKEPERRYQSADALLDDLRRRRHGLPVLARQDTLGYRTRKFVARHRVGVAAAALVAGSLGAGLVATTWQARAAARQAARATAVKDFLVGLFNVSRPEQSLGRDVTARELLERGSSRADSVLAGHPALHAELLGTLASIHASLGDFRRADSMFSRAVAEWRAVSGGRDRPELSGALTGWAQVHIEQGFLEPAESSLVEALSINRRLYAATDTTVLNTLSGLASVARRSDKLARAESLSLSIVDLTRRQLGPDHLETARAINNYAAIVSDDGRRALADTLYRQALAIRRRRLPRDHPDVLISLDNLGAVRRELGDYDESERLLREALAGRRRVQGATHPDLAWTARALSTTLERRGRLAEAESLLTLSLGIMRDLYPPGSPQLANTVNSVAVLNYRMERFDRAIVLTREALGMWREANGPEARVTVAAMNNLGTILTAAGSYADAEPLLRASLRLRQKLFPATHETIGQSWRNLGVLLHRTGRLADAERMLRQGVANQRAALGTDHPRTLDAEVSLGELLSDRGRHSEAEPLLRHALNERSKILGNDDARVAEAQRALANSLVDRGRYADAEALLLASARTLARDPYKRLEKATTLRSLARLYRAWGRPAKAREAERLADAR